jgi:hypothetical protein
MSVFSVMGCQIGYSLSDTKKMSTMPERITAPQLIA